MHRRRQFRRMEQEEFEMLRFLYTGELRLAEQQLKESQEEAARAKQQLLEAEQECIKVEQERIKLEKEKEQLEEEHRRAEEVEEEHRWWMAMFQRAGLDPEQLRREMILTDDEKDQIGENVPTPTAGDGQDTTGEGA